MLEIVQSIFRVFGIWVCPFRFGQARFVDLGFDLSLIWVENGENFEWNEVFWDFPVRFRLQAKFQAR